MTMLQTSDIHDWKDVSTNIGILRQRTAEDGTEIEWTKVKQIRINRNFPMKIGFKLSHHNVQWSCKLTDRRQTQAVFSSTKRAYSNPPKISEAKYEDISYLIKTAVISNPEHKMFYAGLRH